MRNKKHCPLDDPELNTRCMAGEWIPDKNEVDSFRLMDDYISDDIKLKLHNKHKSIPACNSVECKTGTAADYGKKPDHDTDYFVPNFGKDEDIIVT